MHPMQAAFVKHDGFQCGLLHAWTDLFGGRDAHGNRERHPEPVTADLDAGMRPTPASFASA
jgi:hypothetical protein